MVRSNWNPNSPDVVGIEFLGIGVVSNVVQFETAPKAVRFTAQRTGPLDAIAVWSGPLTNNPVQSQAHFTGHRTPFVIDLYPVSGFDIRPSVQTTYPGTITTSANVLDEIGTAPEGNELQFAFDGLYLVPQPGIPTMHVHMPDASAFPLTSRVHSIRLDVTTYAPVIVRRIDQNSNFLWNRTLSGSWFMSELRIEAGTTGPYVAWTPSEIRQFASSVGNRRLQMLTQPGQTNVFDQLGITVVSCPETRAGTAIVEPASPYQWITTSLVRPGTAFPANVVAGGEYILLFRPPGGPQDFGTTSKWDVSGLKDRRPANTFVHFEDLAWDTHDVLDSPFQSALGDMTDGLVPVRLISGNTQVVDTQPYQVSLGVLPWRQDVVTSRVKQRLQVPAGTTEYSALRVNVALFDSPTAPEDKAHLNVQLVNNAGALIAGPFQLTPEMYEASPIAGSTTAGTDPTVQTYRTVTVPFGAGIDINETGGVNAEFILDDTYIGSSITWRIGALISSIPPVSGSDQTAVVSGNGSGYLPPSFAFMNINQPGVMRGDLMVSLLSQAPEITGIGVTGLVQPVTGGPCDPCGNEVSEVCQVTGIAYHHVCWPATTLPQQKFGYYELQRLEANESPDWQTIAILAQMDEPVSGAPVTGVPTCFDDYTHVYGSQVCYRVRQQRTDGTLSDFVDQACITTPIPTGAALVITAQDDPSLNVVFPQVFEDRLPVEKKWTNLDAGQTLLRPVYGRDKHLAFRPLERLGLQMDRRLLVSALCTPEVPSLNVTDTILDIAAAPVDYLVVRDEGGNRFYASVEVPTILQVTDEIGRDLWLVDIRVTELATPIIEADS